MKEVTSPSPQRKPESWWNWRRRDAALGYALNLPLLLFVAFFVAAPLVSIIWTSLHNPDLLNPSKGNPFVGVQNFTLLAGDQVFRSSLVHSLLLAVWTVVLQLVIGLGIALLLNQNVPGRAVFRSIFIIPWALPTVVAAFAIRFFLDPLFGPVNKLLIKFGLVNAGIPFLSQTSTALPSVIVAHVWKGLPYVILVLLAGLQMVSGELREAAQVDGANRWHVLRHVVFPSLRFVITVTAILRFIWTFNWFDLVYLLTGGGPSNATMTLPLRIYITAFRSFMPGQAAAIAVVAMLLLVLFTWIYLRVDRREEG